MKHFLTSILIISTIIGSKAADHKFYVSLTELTVQNDTMQLSIRLFTEDLEYALNELSEEKVFLQPSNPSMQNFVLIKDYLTSKLVASQAAAPLKMNWLGHEFEDDGCWIYAEVPLDDDQSILFIKNTVFFEHFPEQQNIIHFLEGDETTTLMSTKDRPEVRIRLDKD